jgi:hypothetical protein
MWEYRTHVKNVSPWIVVALAATGLLGSHIYQSWSSFNDVNSTEATFQKLIGTPNRRNDPNSRKKKRQNIDNLIFCLKSGSYSVVAKEVMALRNHVYLDGTYDPYLGAILITYQQKLIRDDVDVKFESYEEVAAHYQKYTSNLCYSYLLRRGHWLIYTKHAVRDELMYIIQAGMYPWVHPGYMKQTKGK